MALICKTRTLTERVLHGVDRRGSLNLTVKQLSRAIIDEATMLPVYIDRTTLPTLAPERP